MKVEIFSERLKVSAETCGGGGDEEQQRKTAAGWRRVSGGGKSGVAGCRNKEKKLALVFT